MLVGFQGSSRRRGRWHAHPVRARPWRLRTRRQPGHVHRGAAGAGGQVPHRRRTAGRRDRRRGAQALEGLQPGARVRVVVGTRSGDARHRHATRLRHRPRRRDFHRDEDRARARWMPASPAASTPSAIRPSSTRAPTSSCCCAPIAASPPWQRIKPFFGLRPRHFKPVMPGVLEPRTGLSMGEHCEQMAKTWKIPRAEQDALANAQSRERRRRLEARLLQRPGGERLPGPQDGQQRARRQHGREARLAASRRSTGAAARARSPPAIPRRSPMARPRCC